MKNDYFFRKNKNKEQKGKSYFRSFICLQISTEVHCIIESAHKLYYFTWNANSDPPSTNGKNGKWGVREILATISYFGSSRSFVFFFFFFHQFVVCRAFVYLLHNLVIDEHIEQYIFYINWLRYYIRNRTEHAISNIKKKNIERQPKKKTEKNLKNFMWKKRCCNLIRNLSHNLIA